MNFSKSYVREESNGALRISDTRVSLDSIVYAYLDGASTECIHEQYPAVSLEEIHGALAFYLANRKEVDEYLKRQEKLWEEFRRKADENPSPVVQRLRALKAKALQEKP
jgi:uncharacterized protein (DUF433 family)